MDALCCCQRPAAFISLLCSRATPQTKNNSKNAEVIAMLSACNVSTIVVCLCSIEPLARNSLLCSRAFMEAAKKVVTVMEPERKVVDKPKELTSTNDAHNVWLGLLLPPRPQAGLGKSAATYIHTTRVCHRMQPTYIRKVNCPQEPRARHHGLRALA
jgi:hypothetical protein